MRGGINSTYGAVQAMYQKTTRSAPHAEQARQALNFTLYSVDHEGRPRDLFKSADLGGWQEDAHTHVIHNYADALRAYPVGAKATEGRNMQMNMKFGIGLMMLGVGVWAAWRGWTRKVDPVDVAVVLAAGQSVNENLKLNYDGLYLIEIAAENRETSQAQLGGIGVEWSLWSCGHEVKKGSTAESHSAQAQSGGVARVIGEFAGRAGQSYQLQLKFTTDARELQAAEPRLKVVVSGLARENLQAASLLVFSMVFICEMFGILLVGVGLWRRRAGSGRCDLYHKSP